MTLPANQRRDRYVATGGQTVFPYTFRVFAAGDLVVERLRAGVTTTLVLTTDYTVSGVGNDAGGNVTLTAGALAGDTIAIVSNQPNQRSTDFSESGDFRAAAVNAELDRLWIGIQQLAQELARQITAPKSDPPSSYVLPPREARPNRLLGFDSNGDVVLSTGATVGGVNVSAFTATLLDLASAAAWRSGIGAASSSDVTAAITAALAAAVLRDGSQALTAPLPAGGFRLTNIGAATAMTDAARLEQIGGWLRDNRVLIQERLADGTNGGTATAGGWNARGLTLAEVLDAGNFASVSGSTFTLAAGTWDILTRVPFGNLTGGGRSRLFN
ncbi:MAG: hypothetical protein MUC89_23815, partial [Acetobacteraceae bacterium]|nr:hypothetical protein [Acetobacteraceae bacterium]